MIGIKRICEEIQIIPQLSTEGSNFTYLKKKFLFNQMIVAFTWSTYFFMFAAVFWRQWLFFFSTMMVSIWNSQLNGWKSNRGKHFYFSLRRKRKRDDDATVSNDARLQCQTINPPNCHDQPLTTEKQKSLGLASHNTPARHTYMVQNYHSITLTLVHLTI